MGAPPGSWQQSGRQLTIALRLSCIFLGNLRAVGVLMISEPLFGDGGMGLYVRRVAFVDSHNRIQQVSMCCSPGRINPADLCVVL